MAADAEELRKFQHIGARWWDAEGPMRPLHLLQPARMRWIRDQLLAHFDRDPGCKRPLVDLRVLDVGCGGGLVCEPLARLGARVTGIDPLPSNIDAANAHARAQNLAIAYRVASAEDLVVAGERFDAVLALEVVEHVPDVDAFLAELAQLTRPGGLLLLSTLSRTLSALLLAVVAAERLLGWLPPGTHDWRRFLKPSELAAKLRAQGLRPVALTGLAYDPARERFLLVRDPSVNYLLAAVREGG